MVQIKGSLRRAIKEYKYITKKNWSLEEYGQFWDTVKDYDEIDDETYAYKRRFYDSIKMCSFPDQSKILDIDCRTGNGSVFYNRSNKIKEVVCMSPSKNFLDVCKKRTKKNKINARCYLLEKFPLDFKEKTFDAILCLETIEHISPNQRIILLKELNRVLTNEGELILSMPSLLWEPVHWMVAILNIHHSEGPHRFLARRTIKKLLKKANFKIIKEQTTVIIPVGPKWLTRFGEHLEKLFKYGLMSLLGLRRIYICKKIKYKN